MSTPSAADSVMQELFDSCSPVDYRYPDKEAQSFLSENAFIRYKLRVELALVTVLQRRGLCETGVVWEMKSACQEISAAAVAEEEKKTRHDINALVRCIRRRLPESARPFVHMTATSFDISDTANAARYRDCVAQVVIPKLLKLHQVLAALAIREAVTPQIGRTHGQHAVPITFGFAIAGYVSRLGSALVSLKRLTGELRGKFSGAVGAYNASTLFFVDPVEFEREVLAELGLQPADHATQIVQPEPLARLLFECALAASVLANLADDMRHLQRSEIGEVGEPLAADQVGSSTMPHKRNPVSFENIKSLWKVLVPRLITVLMDCISEHQRDLTNSASARTYGEILCYLIAMTKRLTTVMSQLTVDQKNLARNLALQGDLIAAEPLQLLLAAAGHPDAHEAVRQAARAAEQTQWTLYDVCCHTNDIAPYLARLTPEQLALIENPANYLGLAPDRTKAVAAHWAGVLGYSL